MRVVVKEPGRDAEVKDVGTSLKEQQAVVDGYIEALRLEGDVYLVINEEGRLHDLPPNVKIGELVLVGALFVCKTNGTDFVGLDESEAQHYCEMMTEAGKELN